MARTSLCRVGIHAWVVRREPDVKPYVACRRCSKEKMVDTRPETLAGGWFSSYGRDPD